MSMEAVKLYALLEEEFKPSECTEVFPKIGLQYHHCDEVQRIYTANFASPEVFEQLIALDARECLLFTHHPASQRKLASDPPAVIPEQYLEEMAKRQISLFSYHIPLDRNGRWSPGNNLAKAIAAVPHGEFYFQNGVLMGALCDSGYTTVDQLTAALQTALNHEVKCYAYGEAALQNGRLAIMAGGAKNTEIYRELHEKGINAFITGVTNAENPWVADLHTQAKKYRINLIGGTHYSTEKFAPMAMCHYFSALGLPAQFLPETPQLSEM